MGWLGPSHSFWYGGCGCSVITEFALLTKSWVLLVLLVWQPPALLLRTTT